MTAIATLDEEGRLIVPEEIREHLHLAPGDSVELREMEGGVLLTPAACEGTKEVGGLLIATGEWENPEDAHKDWIREIREERIRELLK